MRGRPRGRVDQGRLGAADHDAAQAVAVERLVVEGVAADQDAVVGDAGPGQDRAQGPALVDAGRHDVEVARRTSRRRRSRGRRRGRGPRRPRRPRRSRTRPGRAGGRPGGPGRGRRTAPRLASSPGQAPRTWRSRSSIGARSAVGDRGADVADDQVGGRDRGIAGIGEERGDRVQAAAGHEDEADSVPLLADPPVEGSALVGGAAEEGAVQVRGDDQVHGGQVPPDASAIQVHS